MKQSHWLALIVWSLSLNCFGQVSFKKGYYIDKQGNKTECLIKDVDWRLSPASVDYRLTEGGEIQKMKTEGLSEFAVGDSKYIRANVQYDQSSQDIKKADVNPNPRWIQGDLLLRVIVSGKASLYHYSAKEYSLFFFSVDNKPIEQLVFKNFINPQNLTQLRTNILYLTQLNGEVRCGDNMQANDKQVPYQFKALVTYFRTFNICSGDVVPEAPKNVRSVSIRLTPGVDFSKVFGRAAEWTNLPNYDFGSNTALRFGVDIQLALPFNHGKWMIMVEPTFQQYTSTKDVGLKYKSIEIPFGVRHRFFLSQKTYVFVNGAALVDFPLAHVQTIQRPTKTYEVKISRGIFGLTAGAGISHGRFSLEGRYYPKRQRTEAGATIYEYTKTTLILGFRVL